MRIKLIDWDTLKSFQTNSGEVQLVYEHSMDQKILNQPTTGHEVIRCDP